MDMWTIFAIALVAMVIALVLAYVLKSRLSDNDVWEDLVDANAQGAKEVPEDDGLGIIEHDDSESDMRPLQDFSFDDDSAEFTQPGVESMRNSNGVPLSSRTADHRRSSRVEKTVPLMVLGTNRRGESFQERTSALSFNLHGCRYSSRHDYAPEGWVTLQVTGTDGAAVAPVRARVCSVQAGQSSRELCQVGVELETPANIWGVSTPPEDWQRLLGSASGPRAAAAAPAVDPSSPPSSFLSRQSTAPDRRAEVAVFPSPATPTPEPLVAKPAVAPAASVAAPTVVEAAAASANKVAFTPEQLLQALQGKLQLAAEHAVDTALAARLDETVKQALSKIEDGWKANVRQTEEFSASRLTEVQSGWERELVVYRSRAEEISKRMESLATSTRQGLVELQKFADTIKSEIEPQFQTRLTESFARVNTDFEIKANQLSERHKAKFTEFAQFASLQARAKLDETVAEARLMAKATHSGVTQDQLHEALNASRDAAVKNMDELLANIRSQVEQQQNMSRRRAEEYAHQLDVLSKQLAEAKAQHEEALAEVRSVLVSSDSGGNVSPELIDSAVKQTREQILNQVEARLGETKAQHERALGEMRAVLSSVSASGGTSPERLESALKHSKDQILGHVEWRLGEVSGRADQQHHVAQQRADELARRLEGLLADSVSTRSQADKNAAEIRAALAQTSAGMTQERFNTAVESLRDELLNKFEWRLGEISGQFHSQHDGLRQRSEELSRHLDALSSDLRTQLEENRTKTESLVQELRPQDLAAMEKFVDKAAREFEVSAARISDRQLVRLMQQKQTLSNEAVLELEARTSETRSLLQKAANTTVDDFRRQVESQMDLIIMEATERMGSALSSIDAESRAACEARRHEVETAVARAAEQSTAEFRSGIKAFLYSCLVAAVSAVDEHAQTTMAGLAADPSSAVRAIEKAAETEKRSAATASTER
jgi:hypothetical protein